MTTRVLTIESNKVAAKTYKGTATSVTVKILNEN